MVLTLWWTVVGAALALWSGALWLMHALLADSQAQVLALQRALHALPVPEGWGRWAEQARDDLVNLGDSVLLVLAMGLGAVSEALPGLSGWLAPLLWTLWGLGALAAVAVGAAFHAVIRASARPAA